MISSIQKYSIQLVETKCKAAFSPEHEWIVHSLCRHCLLWQVKAIHIGQSISTGKLHISSIQSTQTKQSKEQQLPEFSRNLIFLDCELKQLEGIINQTRIHHFLDCFDQHLDFFQVELPSTSKLEAVSSAIFLLKQNKEATSNFTLDNLKASLSVKF